MKEGSYMYSKKNEQRGFPCKPFLFRLIILMFLVFFIVGVLPNIVKPKVITNMESKEKCFLVVI